MIGVFLIESENEDALTKQVDLFRKSKADISDKVGFHSKDMEKFLINLESRFEKITKQLFEQATTNVKLENEIQDLKKHISEQIEPLELFNNLDQFKIAAKLINAGFPAKKASQIAKIVENQRNNELFKSLNDVVERVKIPHGKNMQKAISHQKMLEIVDVWLKK
jgi:endonuclease III